MLFDFSELVFPFDKFDIQRFSWRIIGPFSISKVKSDPVRWMNYVQVKRELSIEPEMKIEYWALLLAVNMSSFVNDIGLG